MRKSPYNHFYWIPRNRISRLVGRLSRVEFPPWLMLRLIKWFIYKYELNDLSELQEPLSTFKTLNQFFTRRLKPETRPIDQGRDAIVAPVDGYLKEYGIIENGMLIQAKGIDYTIDELINAQMAQLFIDGNYMTFYLQPRDCHLIFSPVDGVIQSCYHIPGTLFPVKESFSSRIEGLYTINERLITYIKTAKGLMAVVAVGASNVGNITMEYDHHLHTNIGRRGPSEKYYDQEIRVQRGEHLGTFNLGSTVILLFQKNSIQWTEELKLEHVKYGIKVARYV